MRGPPTIELDVMERQLQISRCRLCCACVDRNCQQLLPPVSSLAAGNTVRARVCSVSNHRMINVYVRPVLHMHKIFHHICKLIPAAEFLAPSHFDVFTTSLLCQLPLPKHQHNIDSTVVFRCLRFSKLCFGKYRVFLFTQDFFILYMVIGWHTVKNVNMTGSFCCLYCWVQPHSDAEDSHSKGFQRKVHSFIIHGNK